MNATLKNILSLVCVVLSIPPSIYIILTILHVITGSQLEILWPLLNPVTGFTVTITYPILMLTRNVFASAIIMVAAFASCLFYIRKKL